MRYEPEEPFKGKDKKTIQKNYSKCAQASGKSDSQPMGGAFPYSGWGK